MKEGIVIEITSNKCNNCSCSNDCKRRLVDKILCELRNNLTPTLNYKQVPESWEEFVEISKKIGNIYKEDEEHISFDIDKCIIIFVKKGGRICLYTQDTNVYSIAENKTPAQMWQIIKNLIGEE